MVTIKVSIKDKSIKKESEEEFYLKAIERIEKYASKAVEHASTPGMVVAISKGDQMLLNKGFGIKSLNNIGKPNNEYTNNTLTPLCSMTKSISAGAISILVNQGKLAWNTPIQKYVPEIEFSDPWVTKHVTILDILTHRTGLSPHMNAVHGKNGLLTSRKDFLQNLKSLPFVGEFRSSYIYNNMMYSLVSYIIKVVSGVSYSKFVQDNIFTPLNITNFTWTTSDLKNSGDYSSPHDYGYSLQEFYKEFKDTTIDDTVEFKFKEIAGWEFNDDVMIGVGTLALSSTDMMKWVQCLMNDGKSWDGIQVIFQVDFLSKPHNTCTKGHEIVSHTGGLPGYGGVFSYIKAKKIAIFIGYNSSDAVRIKSAVDAEILNLNEKVVPEVDNPFPFIEFVIQNYQNVNDGIKVIHPRFEELVGTYTHPAYGEVIIGKEARSGHLSMVRQPEYSVLYPCSKLADDDDGSLSFFAIDGLFYHTWVFKINEDESISLTLKDESAIGKVEVVFVRND
ncbi:hypothetical protein HDV02_002038 [Globomyces sp. JEL0801]|nr:hypothetical protein HDV02_002038 [Globomyces sp. JEL0801]